MQEINKNQTDGETSKRTNEKEKDTEDQGVQKEIMQSHAELYDSQNLG